MTSREERVTIVGVGNLLMGDEGVGVHVASRLMQMPLPDHVEVIDGGTDGFGLLGVILATDRLVLVDAVKGGGEPATLYRFEIDDYRHLPDTCKTSMHQISIEEVVTLSSLLSEPPRTTIIGVEPADLSPGLELSPFIEQKVDRILELVLEAAGVTLTR